MVPENDMQYQEYVHAVELYIGILYIWQDCDGIPPLVQVAVQCCLVLAVYSCWRPAYIKSDIH